MKTLEPEHVKPAEIEARSFEIITQELLEMGKSLAPGTERIVKRCIHTSADFDYADNLYFSDGAVEKALQALRQGADIVTDTRMAQAGINARFLAKLGGQVHCFMADEDVARAAAENGTTRACASMDKAAMLAAERGRDFIYAIGNAPTALIRLQELIDGGKVHPLLIIGVPVGFVNVVQAKEVIREGGAPCIIARGRKGGSNIAACICNALLYQIRDEGI